MKKLLLLLCMIVPFHAWADDYELGSYWVISGVDTHPGHFDDYIDNINGAWRKSMEMQMEEGIVKSYKILTNVNARTGEPNLWLMVEYTSAGAFLDRPKSYWDEQGKKIWGSMDKGQEENIKRGELRTLMSDVMARELILP